MSVLTDFYLATPEHAQDYDADQACAEVDRAQYKGITPLELSMLWAIIHGKEWDVAMMDEFPNILTVDGGERLIYEIPRTVLERLSTLSAPEIGSAAIAWSKTEELACEAEDIQPVIEEFVRLSLRALSTQRGLYLWICV